MIKSISPLIISVYSFISGPFFEEPDYPIQADGEPVVASRIEVDVLGGALHVWHPTH